MTASFALRGAIVGVSALLSLAAHAAGDMQNPDRLRGEMFVAGATLVDPPADEPRDTHAYLTITGEPARRLYNTLKVPDISDLCEPGRRLKSIGHLRCSVGTRSTDAKCDFSLDLTTGTLDHGLVC